MSDITASKRIKVVNSRQSASVRRSPHSTMAMHGEALLEPVERREQSAHRLLIGALAAREARSIDAVVDGRVDALVQRVDIGAQFGGIEIARRRADRDRRPN